jgi:hypothetical protein
MLKGIPICQVCNKPLDIEKLCCPDGHHNSTLSAWVDSNTCWIIVPSRFHHTIPLALLLLYHQEALKNNYGIELGTNFQNLEIYRKQTDDLVNIGVIENVLDPNFRCIPSWNDKILGVIEI